MNDTEWQWVTANDKKCNEYFKNNKVTLCSNDFVANFKLNLSFCYRAFSTSFKQLLTNDAYSAFKTLSNIYDGTFLKKGLRLVTRNKREKKVDKKNQGSYYKALT